MRTCGRTLAVDADFKEKRKGFTLHLAFMNPSNDPWLWCLVVEAFKRNGRFSWPYYGRLAGSV